MKTLGILFVSSILLLSGCGTIIHGKQQNINIETEPPGLTVIAGGKSCVTPCAIEVSRKSTHINITKPNGEQIPCELNRTFNGWSVILGNIWNEIIIGLIVDVVSGGAYTLGDVDIKLPELASTTPPYRENHQNRHPKNEEKPIISNK